MMLVGTLCRVEVGLIIDPSSSRSAVVVISVESSRDNDVAFSHISSKFGGKVQDRVSLMFVHWLSMLEHSQYFPVYSLGHEQVKESTPSLHFPPFKHLEKLFHVKMYT